MGRAGALLVVAAVVLRLPSIHQPLDRDSALYAAIGRFMDFGTLPYRDLADHKQPLVYPVYKVIDLLGGHTLTAVRLSAALVAGLVATALYLGLRDVAGRGPALVAAGLVTVVSAAAAVQGMDLNTEHLLALPATAAVMFALAGAAVPAGICVGLAVLAKAVGVLVAIPVLIALRGRLVPFALAAAVPVLLVVVIYAIAGGLDELWFWNLTYNRTYVDQYVSTEGRVLIPDATLGLLLLGGAGCALITRKWVALSFLLAMWAGAWFGGRAFPHYFAPTVPAAAMCVAVALEGRLRTVAACVAVAMVAVFGLDAGSRFGQSSNEIALDIYGPQAQVWIDAQPLSAAIGAQARPGDRLYVTSAEPEYYWLSGVEPATRYLFDYPVGVTPERFRREIDADLCQGPPPRFLVLPVPGVPDFVCLDPADYDELARRGTAVALVRRDDPA